METVVAINPYKKESLNFEEIGHVKFGEESVIIGKVNLSKPSFDRNDKKNLDYVLLKVKAFSCNYRDKAILAQAYSQCKDSDRLFFPFGSEFSAEVVDIGVEVNEFEIGDIVMSDCSYPDSGKKGVKAGVATNYASIGWLRIHKNKIMKAPENLSNEEIACFSLGSQTAASMIRRSGILSNGGTPIVFSARSATSLFIIRQLVSHGITPICLTTSQWSDKEKAEIYPAKVELLSTFSEKFISHNYIITHVFDPFYDMNIDFATYCLSMGGTYITCGLRDQHPLLSKSTPQQVEPLVRGAVEMSIVKNLTLIGNCLGNKEDLLDAIALNNDVLTRPIIDTVYKTNEGTEFLNHSFFEFNKFGKSVLAYSNAK